MVGSPSDGVQWDIAHVLETDGSFDDEAALAEIRARAKRSDAMYESALYVYRVIYIAKRYGPGTGRSQRGLADDLGVSPAYVTRLKRLGRALVIHEVPRDSRLWAQLVQRADDRQIAGLLDSDFPVPLDLLRDLLDGAQEKGREDRPNEGLHERLIIAVATIRDSIQGMSQEEMRDLRGSLMELLSELQHREQSVAQQL